MSGPYDQYGGNYGQQSQYPQQGYSGGGYPPQQGYDQSGYQQQQPYGQQSQYPQQGYGGSAPQDQNFGPPHRQDSFGPPQQGGFQHGQANGQYGAYDASNPQGHPGYYGGQQQGGYDGNAQNQQYQQMGQQQPTGQAYPDPSQHQFARQSSEPNAPNYDPNAPPMPESDRGLLGAVGGGVAGHFLGKKSNHGFLGTIGGAILGSVSEDFMKDKKKKKHHGASGSSWGGKY
jgi:hypothetical protein